MPLYEKIKASIGTADEEAVAVCCRSSMLQKLYALIKNFNKVIGTAVAVYNFKIIIKVSIYYIYFKIIYIKL